MGGEPVDRSERDARLDEAVAEYLLEAEAGRSLDRGRFLARYPDLAGELSKFLDDRDRIRRLVGPLGGEQRGGPLLPHACPHCRGPLQAGGAGAVCTGCGGSFRLEADAAARPPDGRRIGRFELTAVVGRGAFGTVYKGWDPDLDRVVAVKVPRPGAGWTAADVGRFLGEARVAEQLHHPGIVRVYESGRGDDGLPYLVSEFVPGRTLGDLILDRRPAPDRAAEILAAVADALHHAHRRRVVHRDVKPSNILLREGHLPMVADFGLALLDGGQPTLTRDGEVLGTPAYMSPEQARGESHRVDARSDVYSLGVVLYELLTGQRPVAGTARMVLHQILHEEPRPPRSLNDRLPRDLETVCLKCLRKEPERRYQSAAALAEDLRRFRQGRPVVARPVGRVERLVRWGRRNPTLAVSSGTAAVLLFAVAAVSAAWAVHADHQATTIRGALEESERRRAENYLDRGQAEAERGEVGLGLLWMARGLEAAPPVDDDLARVVRANLAQWGNQHLALTDCQVPPGKAIGFGPDGRAVWVVDRDPRTVRRWEPTAGGRLGPPLRHPTRVTALAVSDDGKSVATGCAGGGQQIRVWDAVTGELRRALEARGEVRGIVFAGGGRSVLAAQAEGNDRDPNAVVCGWEVETGQVLGTPFSLPARVDAVSLSPDGRTLLTSARTEKLVRRWEVPGGRTLGVMFPHQGSVRAVAFSPDGRAVLTGGEDHRARLWDSASGRQLAVLYHREPVTAVGFGTDSRTVLTASPGDAVRAWRGPAFAEPLRRLPHGGRVLALAVAPDGRRIATGSDDGQARVWETDVGQPVRVVKSLPHPSPLSAVAFSPDGKFLATGMHQDGEARLWDLDTGQYIPLNHGDPVRQLAFSPDGRRVATVGYGRDAWLWDTKSGRPSIPRPLSHDGGVAGLAFSPDGRTAVTAGGDGTARRWDVATGLPAGPPLHHGGAVLAVACSPDGRTVVTGGEDGTATLWEPEGGAPVGPRLPHGYTVWSVAFSPNGRTVVTGSWDHSARLWDAGTGQPRGPPLRHAGPIRAVAVSSDGLWAVTASADGTARAWDLGTGRPLGPPLPHGGEVHYAAVGPGDRWFVTAGLGSTALIWPAPLARDGPTWQTTLRTQVITGLEFDPVGGVRVLDAADWHQRRQRLLEVEDTGLP